MSWTNKKVIVTTKISQIMTEEMVVRLSTIIDICSSIGLNLYYPTKQIQCAILHLHVSSLNKIQQSRGRYFTNVDLEKSNCRSKRMFEVVINEVVFT